MLMRLWYSMVRFERLTGKVITLLMRPLTLVGVVLVIRLLMLVVTCPGFVVAGILFSSTFIGFSLLFLELWSIMMVVLVLLLIP